MVADQESVQQIGSMEEHPGARTRFEQDGVMLQKPEKSRLQGHRGKPIFL